MYVCVWCFYFLFFPSQDELRNILGLHLSAIITSILNIKVCESLCVYNSISKLYLSLNYLAKGDWMLTMIIKSFCSFHWNIVLANCNAWLCITKLIIGEKNHVSSWSIFAVKVKSLFWKVWTQNGSGHELLFNFWNVGCRVREGGRHIQLFEVEVANGVLLEVKMLCGCL